MGSGREGQSMEQVWLSANLEETIEEAAAERNGSRKKQEGSLTCKLTPFGNLWATAVEIILTACAGNKSICI